MEILFFLSTSATQARATKKVGLACRAGLLLQVGQRGVEEQASDGAPRARLNGCGLRGDCQTHSRGRNDRGQDGSCLSHTFEDRSKRKHSLLHHCFSLFSPLAKIQLYTDFATDRGGPPQF